ncbi:hypothetical protein [Pectobacterium phage PcCB7V]|nr:hypothetical protein [Pectobacterium phage PcCB7V]
MSSFDAIFLHGVMDYARGAKPTPTIPDFKDLQRRLGNAKLHSEDRDLATDLNNLASDFDFDNEIEQYVDKAYEKIDFLHRGVRDACADLIQNWDPDNMTRDQMITFVENLQNNLEEYLPGSKMMREVAFAWLGYEVATFVKAHHALDNVLLCHHTTDDMYHSHLRDEKQGRLDIKVGQGGVLVLEAQWAPGKLTFTSDKKVVMSKGIFKDNGHRGDNFVMPITEFTKHFECWATPTEEEIELFDVLHPGANWTVLRYLRDYHEKNYISNKKIITTIPTSSLISVSTSL